MSAFITSTSRSEYKKSPPRGRIITKTGICTHCFTTWRTPTRKENRLIKMQMWAKSSSKSIKYYWSFTFALMYHLYKKRKSWLKKQEKSGPKRNVDTKKNVYTVEVIKKSKVKKSSLENGRKLLHLKSICQLTQQKSFYWYVTFESVITTRLNVLPVCCLRSNFSFITLQLYLKSTIVIQYWSLWSFKGQRHLAKLFSERDI